MDFEITIMKCNFICAGLFFQAAIRGRRFKLYRGKWAYRNWGQIKKKG